MARNVDIYGIQDGDYPLLDNHREHHISYIKAYFASKTIELAHRTILGFM